MITTTQRLASICILFLLHPFFSLAQFQLNDDAYQLSCNCYSLTGDTSNQSGTAWNINMLDLNSPFNISTEVMLGCKTTWGADGMVFSLQNQGIAIGGNGGGMGYAGLTPSIGVVIDTYENATHNDPAYDHISLASNGEMIHGAADELVGPVGCVPSQAGVEDCLFHDLLVTWDPVTQVMEVYFDGFFRFSYTGDIINNIFAGDPMVYWGMTSANGGLSNDHDFCIKVASGFQNAIGSSACVSEQIQFTDTSISGMDFIAQYNWDFGDGTTSNLQNPIHAFDTSGLFYVQLEIVDGTGCTDVDSFPMSIQSHHVAATVDQDSVCPGSQVQLNTIVTDAPLTACNYTLEMWDTYGDGWNPNGTGDPGQIEVFINGALLDTFFCANQFAAAGTNISETVTFAVYPGDNIELVYTYGSWEEENWYYLFDGNGNQVFQDGSDFAFTFPSAGSVYTGTATCPIVTPSYSYSWSSATSVSNNFIANPTANVTATTIYSIVVDDGLGCTVTDDVTVTEALPDFMISAVLTDANCAQNDGNIDLAVVNGSGSYSYAWSNGEVTQDISLLIAGGYTVTVTDNGNGCLGDSLFTLNDEAGVSVITVTGSAVGCNGGNDGVGIAFLSGGGTPYNYLWSNGETNIAATALSSGVNEVSVTDVNGCLSNSSVSISQPSLLIAVVSCTNTSIIGGSDGTSNVSGTGGGSSYTYLWSNGQTTVTAAGLSAGSISVTITDNSGCVAISNCVVNDPGCAVSLATSVTNVSCFGISDGTITAQMTNGVAPFSYQWNDGQTTAMASGLLGNSYAITISDVNSCVVMGSDVVNSPSQISLNISCTDVSVPNGSDGLSSVIANGGASGYTYLWGSGATTNMISGLSAGALSVVVSDADGCTVTDNCLISSPGCTITVANSVSDVSCNGLSDGAAVGGLAGGSTPFSYLWSNSATTNTVSGLSSGTLNVTITDNNGCEASGLISVSEPSVLLLNINLNDPLCAGSSNGDASANVSGGSTPYSYLWNNGQSISTITGLDAGVVSVSISDILGCVSQTSGTLTDPNAGSAWLDCFNATGLGLNDGTSLVSSQNMIAPLSYSWSDGQTTSTAVSLSAGPISVTVVDNNGCAAAADCLISETVCLLTVTESHLDVDCNGNANGSIEITTSGATNYTYAWSASANTLSTATGLISGNYNVTISVNQTCYEVLAISISEPNALSLISTSFQDTCNAGVGVANVLIGGGVGPYSYLWENGTTSAVSTGLSEGTIGFTLTDGNDCLLSEIVDVGNTTGEPLLLNEDLLNIPCDEDNSGVISLNPTGGHQPYFYFWSNQSIEPTVTGLSAGQYAVTILDKLGCNTEASFTINESESPVASFEINPASFEPNAEVSIAGNSTGQDSCCWDFGDGDISFLCDTYHSWSDTGVYTVVLIVVNSEGCADTTSAQVNVKHIGEFDFPSVFSPNGDGQNEVFKVQIGGYTLIKAVVLNRWGHQINEWSDPNVGWDGTKYSGLAAPNGTYFYIIEVMDEEGISLEPFTGSITLVR